MILGGTRDLRLMAYSIDTSYFIEAWNVWYPYDKFEGVWRVFASAACSGDLFVIDSVYNELKRHVPDIVKFFDYHASGWKKKTTTDSKMITALNALEADLVAGNIHRRYNTQNIEKYMCVADPALVVHAELYGHVVISNEISDPSAKKGPKIPDLCRLKGVSHASPAEFALKLPYKFVSLATKSSLKSSHRNGFSVHPD